MTGFKTSEFDSLDRLAMIISIPQGISTIDNKLQDKYTYR